MINEFHNTFIGRGDYLPASSAYDKLDNFLSHRIGMFISYGLTSFTTSDSYTTNYLIDPPDPSTFAAPSVVDSAQWATEAANLGCEYAILTTGHHIGFNIFPYTAPYPSENTYDSNRGLLSVPVYNRYDVSVTPSSDQNIIGKFLDKCVVEGIKSGLYYNLGKNINIRRGLDLIDASYDQTGTYSLTYQNYINFVINELEWLLTNYTFDYLWLDAPFHAPRYYDNNRNNKRFLQDVVNACKKINPNVLVNVNYDCPETPNRQVLATGTDNTRPPFTFDGTELVLFPEDILSFEYFRTPFDTSELLPPTTHKGTSYYMPKEVISTLLQNGQYFARNDVFQVLESAATLQTKYDYCQANGIPLLLNVAVNKAGVIPANQLTRFGEIVL